MPIFRLILYKLSSFTLVSQSLFMTNQYWTQAAEGKILLTPRHSLNAFNGLPALLMYQRRKPNRTVLNSCLISHASRGHVKGRLDGKLIKNLLLTTPPQTQRRRMGGQLKTWTTTTKADLEPLSGPRFFGYARWRKDRVKVSSEPAVHPSTQPARVNAATRTSKHCIS